jgi:hypothetical protein
MGKSCGDGLDADLGSLQKACTPPASCAYNDSDANLLAVRQAVGQPTRTVRDMSDLAHAPDATVAAVHGQRFCPDTEEVTGSNPVSPTKKALVSHPFATLPARVALGSVDLSAYRLCAVPVQFRLMPDHQVPVAA